MIVISIVSVLFLAAVIAFILYYTNNFTTELTTFYVQYGAREIRRDTGRMQFESGVIYNFRCEYPFGFPANEKGERYRVSVEVNEAGKEIEYLVDGSSTRFYPKSPDISQSFEITKHTDSFTFCIPAETTLKSIISKAYEGKEVMKIPAVDLTAKDYLSLVVKSYDGGTVIRIGFGFEGIGSSDEQETDPPEEVQKYAIEYDTLGSSSVYGIEFECVAEAAAGETVTFTVRLWDTSGGIHDEYYYPVEIVRIALRDIEFNNEDEEIGSGEGTFSFTMPPYVATIMIYIMPTD